MWAANRGQVHPAQHLLQETAIVTSIPGTTRDVIEEVILIAGVPVRLVDTAGIRQGLDEAERLGVERSRQQAARADLILW